MTHTNNEKAVREHFEKFWNQKQIRSLEEICLPQVELHVGEEILRGCEAIRNASSLIFEAFPTIRFNIDDVIATENRVVIRWTGKGTHQGTFMRIPPTGKNFSYWGVSVYEMQDGKIARQWNTADMHILLAHLRGDKSEISFQRAA